MTECLIGISIITIILAITIATHLNIQKYIKNNKCEKNICYNIYLVILISRYINMILCISISSIILILLLIVF